MRKITGGCVAGVAAVVVGATPALALAPVVVVNTHDPDPGGPTRPTLVSSLQTIKVHTRTKYPHTLVRFRVYPETNGATLPSTCQRVQFRTSRHRTNSTGSVTITLAPPKRLCRGLIYQAGTLIGTGDVPDKWAHMCVRGRVSQYAYACESSRQ